MEDWKRDLGNLLKLLGSVLVAGAGGRIVISAVERAAMIGGGDSSGWLALPRICGTCLLVVGSAYVLYYLLERPLNALRSIRINVGRTAETIPAPPAAEEEAGSKSSKRK